MEPPRSNREWGFALKSPSPTDVVISGSLFYLLHSAPGVHELAAAGVGVAALRCIRWLRMSG